MVGSHTLGGGSTTRTLSCSATINEVVSEPDKLWIGFQDGGNATYADWYELKPLDSAKVVLDQDCPPAMTVV